MIARDQTPDLSVVPVEAVRTVAFHRDEPQDAEVVFRIELRQRVDAQRCRPQRLRLLDPRDAVDTGSPRRLIHLHRLAGLDVGLHDLADRLVLRPRGPPAADAAVRVQPEITAADGEPAGVVRFGLYFVQHFSRLPIDLENLLGNLIANPQTVGRCFERVRVTVRRFEQPLDLGLARRHRRRLAGRAAFLRARHASRGHSRNQRRCRADEFTACDLHRLLRRKPNPVDDPDRLSPSVLESPKQNHAPVRVEESCRALSSGEAEHLQSPRNPTTETRRLRAPQWFFHLFRVFVAYVPWSPHVAQNTNFNPNWRIRGSPELGSVRVIRPSVDGLLTAVLGMSKLTMLKMLKNSTRACTYDELLKWKFFDTAMSQICSDGS